jgi:hypothetical protein
MEANIMMTVRQIERLWQSKAYRRLSGELLSARQEASFALEGTDRPCFVAALAIIRMDELNQAHHPLAATLLRAVLTSQDRDGGWADPATTALCLRALLLNRGNGAAIDAGMNYLASLQKEQGIWPAGPIRRMPEDASASLFILYQLGENPRFRDAVRFEAAIEWFACNASALSRENRSLCEWASLRWRVPRNRKVETGLFVG